MDKEIKIFVLNDGQLIIGNKSTSIIVENALYITFNFSTNQVSLIPIAFPFNKKPMNLGILGNSLAELSDFENKDLIIKMYESAVEELNSDIKIPKSQIIH